MDGFRLKHREQLLRELADGFKANSHHRLDILKVSLYGGRRKRPLVEFFGAALAFDYIVNDIVSDADHNWADANRVGVEPY